MPVMPHLHIIPAPPLYRFVELLWYYQEPPKPHARERLMPDGCVSLVINLAENQTRIYDADDVSKMRTFSACSVSGPQTKCFAIDTDEQTCVIGVSFRPGGAVPFLKLPSDELHNQHLNLEDLWGRLARDLHERSLAAQTPREKLRDSNTPQACLTASLSWNTPLTISWLSPQPQESLTSPKKLASARAASSNFSSNTLA
jgi:hypothetical protein